MSAITKRYGLFIGVLLCMTFVQAQEAPHYDRAADPHGFTVFMQEGGWCWYQDPRAIIQHKKLYLGGVRGNDSGAAYVGVYHLKRGKALGKVLMQDQFEHDDHNAPVLYARPDGRTLAIYARHHTDHDHYYRISKPRKALQWGDEMTYTHDYPKAGKVTYMNLFYLKEEDKLYNFYRGIEFNPSFITSTDQGHTWGEPTHFIASELEGTHRPYGRYAGDGVNTIHISFTDGHPRKFGNNIYYAAFRQGKFYRANGEFIKDLKKDGPLRPSEAELVFKGSGKPGSLVDLSAPESAWTSSISFDHQGNPHIGYTLYLSNQDHRYRIAAWDGDKWIDREVAYGGTCLYDRESSYTGLITLDPEDPGFVVISTDVDPSTGKDLGGKHEIYKAWVERTDDVHSIQWEAVTQNSPVRNIRPVIARGEGYRVLAWLRGDFRTYTSYQLDVVGEVERIGKR